MGVTVVKYLSRRVERRVVADLGGGGGRVEGGGRVAGQPVGEDRCRGAVERGHRRLHVRRCPYVRVSLVTLKGRRRKEVDVAAMTQRQLIIVNRVWIMHGGVRRMYRVKLTGSNPDRVGRCPVEDQLPLL